MDQEYEYQTPEEKPEQPAEPINPQPVNPQPYYGSYVAPDHSRYQPSGQYHTVRPEQPAYKPQEKKRSGVKTFLIVLMAVALAAGGAFMGGIVGANWNRIVARFTGGSIVENSGNTQNNSNGGSSIVYEGNRENSTIDINQIDTNKVMTPAEVYALNVNSTVGITTSITTNYWGYTTTSAASGSGFFYTDDGYIVTNYHVIENSSSISVSLYDGTSLDAKLVGFDASNDVAVLKVEGTGFTPVILGDSANMNVGDSVLAIGNPLGELTFSLTAGTVSALNREVTFSDGLTMNLIQTDCAINSGNSGGALFNLYGEVVGITNAKYSGNSASGASIDNIGFAIPMNHARGIVDSIIENGYVVKPYIGVTITDVSEEAQGYGLPSGASVQDIVSDSPAEKAGLKRNDIITHINGEKIDSSSALKAVVSESKPGDVLTLTVWRKNETVEIKVTVGKQTTENAVQQEPSSQEQQNPIYPYIPNFGWGF